MRQRLLDATVDCLVTYGYAGTTTHRVAEVAGVTRGAQIHHFRAKEDLVVAAIEYLAQQRAESVARDLADVRESPDPAATVLDFLWEAHQGPLFVATIELWIAGRTDPVLAAQIQRVEPVVSGAMIAAIGQVLSDRAARRDMRHVLYTAMDALRGILIADFVDDDPDRARRRWDRASARFRRDLHVALAEPEPLAEPERLAEPEPLVERVELHPEVRPESEPDPLPA